MGRAMLIICAGAIIALGYIGFGSAQQGRQMTERGAGYAKFVQTKNAAHTAIQIAMNEINGDPNFVNNYKHPDTTWNTTIDGADVKLYVDQYFEDPDFWEPDSIRLVSTASYMGLEDIKVVGVYLKNPYQEYVEPFRSPLTIATDNYTFNANGESNTISGVDKSGQCNENQAAETPAVTLMQDDVNLESELSTVGTEGTETTVTDTSLSYEPTDDLIERLKNTDGVVYLTQSPYYNSSSQVYDGPLGSEGDPGVFFVDGPVKFSGGTDTGYGILAVLNEGTMAMENSDLTVSGNFTFNGLVVFENAQLFDGNGTPTINGSVLIGNTNDDGSPIDITLNGNVNLQYDCLGEMYAKKAAALAVQQNRYTRIVTYE